MMLQTDTPQDLVLATGETHSVREFCELAFAVADVEIAWKGEGLEEIGYGTIDGRERVLIRVAEKYHRPTEVDVLLGDPTKAKEVSPPRALHFFAAHHDFSHPR